MAATVIERVSNFKAVLAAMVYLATFLAMSYGIYSLARGGSFLDSFALAFPRAFAGCALLFACAYLNRNNALSEIASNAFSIASYSPRISKEPPAPSASPKP